MISPRICRQGPFMLQLTAWTLAVVFPSTPQLPGLDTIDSKPFIRQLHSEAPFTIRATLVVAVLLFNLTPLLTLGIPLPAFALSKARADEHAQRLSASPVYLLRQIMLMLKTIGGLVWGAAPDVRQKLTMPAYGEDSGGWRKS
jgi:hypothetical protein